MFEFFRSKIFLRQFLSFFSIICLTFLAISFVLLTMTNISLENQQLYVVESYRFKAIKELKRWLEFRSATIKNQALLFEALGSGQLDSPRLQKIIQQQVNWDENFSNIVILDEKGDVINSKDGPLKNLNLSERSYYLNGIQGKATITGFYKNKQSGEPVMAIGQPIFINGKPRYVVAGLIGLERFRQIIEDMQFGEWGHAYLINDRGMFITNSKYIQDFMSSEGIKDKERYNLESLAVKDLLQKKSGTSQYSDFTGQRVFGSYEWIAPLQVGLIVEFNKKGTMKPTQDLLGSIQILAFLVLLAAIVMSYILSRRIIQPLRLLINATQRITQQNYQEQIRIKTDSELDVLVNNFNKMQTTIQIREEELQRKNDALKERMAEVNEANKLKSQFLANMSHELRTPLNSIIGFTTRVIKKSSDLLPPTQLENLNIVKEEAENLLQLINSLLDYSKIEAGKMDAHLEEFDLVEVVTEVGIMVETLLEGKEVKYEEEFCIAKPIPIYSDRIKVKQILINLLSNAFKYSEKGTVKISVDKKGYYYQITVSDQGIGIASEHLEKVFDEFHQVDGSYTRKVGGTGLGLSITKRFVELLQGRIEVTSTYGIGSCFTIYLPVRFQQEGECREGEIFCQSSTGKKKVVCIEDDFNIQRLYKQYLDEYEFKVIFFDGREEILPKIIEFNPEVILLDIMLPYRDGWEILAELKGNSLTRKIPVIMISLLSEKNLAYGMRADEYLIKPVTQEELIETINRTIGSREGLNVLVTDDDENYLNLIGQFLREEAINYRIARDGEEALVAMQKKKPDLLLLDIMMPKKDGFTVMEEIKQKEEWKDVVIIVLTAKNLSNKEKAYLRERASCVLEKVGNHIEQVMENILRRIKERENE